MTLYRPTFVLTLLLATALGASAWAQDVRVPYEGLLNINDEAFTGDAQLRFTIYDENDSSLWAEEWSSDAGSPVSVYEGRFFVALGEYVDITSTLAPDIQRQLFLGIDVRALDGSWVSMAGRERLTYVPWAISSTWEGDYPDGRNVTVAGDLYIEGPVTTTSVTADSAVISNLYEDNGTVYAQDGIIIGERLEAVLARADNNLLCNWPILVGRTGRIAYTNSDDSDVDAGQVIRITNNSARKIYVNPSGTPYFAGGIDVANGLVTDRVVFNNPVEINSTNDIDFGTAFTMDGGQGMFAEAQATRFLTNGSVESLLFIAIPTAVSTTNWYCWLSGLQVINLDFSVSETSAFFGAYVFEDSGIWKVTVHSNWDNIPFQAIPFATCVQRDFNLGNLSTWF